MGISGPGGLSGGIVGRMGAWHSILDFFGIVNESGKGYAFWSGFGSDLGEMAIVGGLIALIRKHNCEVKGCWRMGRHTTAAGQSVCRNHHPDDSLTAEDIKKHHLAALERLGLQSSQADGH